MLIRRLAVFTTIFVLASMGWAKERITAQSLVAKSDALYYTPAAHGVNDMIVDVVIKQLADDPVGKNAKITYFYAGEDRERVAVSNIPDEHADYRNNLFDVVTPFSQFLMPRPASATFTDMSLRMEKVFRMVTGVKETTFYQVSGIADPPKSGVKEYHVLLDAKGVLYQVENVLSDGTLVMASIDNIETADGYQVSTVMTRLPNKNKIQWKIEHLEYETIQGYLLPISLTVKYRDELNRPIKDMGDIDVQFANYQINTGNAANALAALDSKSTDGAPAIP